MADYAMFIPKKSEPNLVKGLAAGTWGWQTDLLDHWGQILGGQTGRERVAALQTGDRLVIATGKPGASILRRPDPDRPVVLKEVYDCRVTRPLHRDHSSIWEDEPDSYCERIQFTTPDPDRWVDGDAVPPDLLRALSDSSKRGSNPFPFTGLPALSISEPPSRSAATDTPPRPARASKATIRDYEAEQRRNSDIGLRGELWVLEFERDRLRNAGHADLADCVVHASVEEGDGLGYDIRSFNEDGTVRFIEVKSTIGNERRPFPISAREVRFAADEAGSFALYRVYDLDGTPGCYVLEGDVRDHFHLDPVEFMAKR